jgi:hypothetical protein
MVNLTRLRAILRRLLAASVKPSNRNTETAAPAPPSPVQFVIERYSYSHGALHITGLVYAANATVTSLALVLPDGRASEIAGHGTTIPDPSQPSGAPIRAARFDQALQLHVSPVDVARAVLRVTFQDGAAVSIGDLGQPVDDPAHRLVSQFQIMLRERQAGRLLEVGSRARSGVIRKNFKPAAWEYSGFDILAGTNVDVVGDAHRLSLHYPAQSFDAVMAFSVLEHLLMPWKFIIELNRVLKIGAIGCFTTHQAWPLHDQPWDFWRFSDRAWTGLLNSGTGFEIIEAAMGEPCYFVARRCHPAVAFDDLSSGRLASYVLFRKTSETTLDWPVELSAITETNYPPQEINLNEVTL